MAKFYRHVMPTAVLCRSEENAMKRRASMFLLGAAATTGWPFSTHAQQKSMPVIGWLNAGAPGPGAPLVAAFRQGLGDSVSKDRTWRSTTFGPRIATTGCRPWRPSL